MNFPLLTRLVLRRRKRGRQVIVEVEERAAVIEATSPEPSPLGAVLSAEERAKVRDAIARLPENYRVPLVLRYYAELSYDEIAQQLGLKRDYVAALLFRPSRTCAANWDTGASDHGMLFGTSHLCLC